MKEIKKVWHIVVSIMILLVIWQIAVMVCDFSTVLFPSPSKVAIAWRELCTTGLQASTSHLNLFAHMGASLYRFFIGYVSATLCAVTLGLVFGWYDKLYAYVDPIVQLLRPIAPVAWAPFIVLWFGIGDIPAIAIIFIAGFFPIFISTVTAVRRVDSIYIKVAKSFGLSERSTVMNIIFPAVFPQIASSLHLALSTSWIFLVSGEMIGSQSGLGFLIMDTKNCMRSDALLATMFTIGLIGLLLDKLIGIGERFITNRWGFGVTAIENK